MKLLNVLKIKKYLALAILLSVLMFSIYVYTQVLFIVENIDLWFSTVPLLNLILFIAFSGIFGMAMSYQVYLWKQPKTCSIKQSTPGAAGTLMSFLVVQCPACASLGALFLPVSAIAVLTVLSVPITLLSISLLLFTIFRLGGFKK